jgi:hypothetical protein
LLLAISLFAGIAHSERINQEGRILGTLPVVTSPILFNTTNADAITSAMQIFPVTNPWNEDISRLPVLTNSDAMIAQIISDLAANRRTLIAEMEMNFVLLPDNQARQAINFFNYPDESDLDGGVSPDGLYPIPVNLPIETWPTGTSLSLLQWQTNINNGDRHSIMVEPGAGYFWETWLTRLVGTNWQASNGAKFNLNTNGLRPAGWTSGDAAGLPMFSALVRYDEAERGMVEHACRIVVKRSLYENYIYPATHFASASTNTSVNLPSMGQRVRLKSNFYIPVNWTREEKAILLGLKKYGALVADNGNFFSISVTPDDRWPANCFNDLTSVSITNFEIVQSTGPNEGPRSPGAPTANAGADQSIVIGAAAPLNGAVAFTGAMPAVQWKQYSGPGLVTFADVLKTNTTATFSEPGVYTLELSAADGVHAVAYDAMVVTVAQVITLAISHTATNVNLSWTGGTAPYVLQQQINSLAGNEWNDVLTTSVQQVTLPISSTNSFFRVVCNTEVRRGF